MTVKRYSGEIIGEIKINAAKNKINKLKKLLGESRNVKINCEYDSGAGSSREHVETQTGEHPGNRLNFENPGEGCKVEHW